MHGLTLPDHHRNTMAARQQPLRELVVVLDALEESCAASLRQDALNSFGHLAALSAVQLQPFHVGLCTISKLDNGRDVQLKVKPLLHRFPLCISPGPIMGSPQRLIIR